MRYTTVLVSGPSMLPTLREGDCLLVRRGGVVTAGALVVARLHARPDLLVVKRALRPAERGGWVLGSDNPAVRSHGLTGGPGDVEGVVWWRYWPLPVCRPR